MCEVDEERQSDELLMLGEFIEHFNVHYSLLLRRYKKFRELSKYNLDNIDLITYLDIIVVQLCVLKAPKIKIIIQYKLC